MEDTGRSYLVGVRVSALEKEAIRRRAEEQKSSQSEVAHQMMRRGNLERLVDFYFGDDAAYKSQESGYKADE